MLSLTFRAPFGGFEIQIGLPQTYDMDMVIEKRQELLQAATEQMDALINKIFNPKSDGIREIKENIDVGETVGDVGETVGDVGEAADTTSGDVGDNWVGAHSKRVAKSEMSRALRSGDATGVLGVLGRWGGYLEMYMRLAAKNGSLGWVRYFSENGACNWERGLITAAKGGDVKVVNFFIRRGAKDIRPAMDVAIKYDKIEPVHLFLNMKKDWDMPCLIRTCVMYMKNDNHLFEYMVSRYMRSIGTRKVVIEDVIDVKYLIEVGIEFKNINAVFRLCEWAQQYVSKALFVEVIVISVYGLLKINEEKAISLLNMYPTIQITSSVLEMYVPEEGRDWMVVKLGARCLQV